MPSNRLSAFSWHLAISTLVCGLLAGWVFGVWYPGALSTITGVSDVFLMLLAVDLVLGPCLTLLVYNRKKPELRRDLAVIAALQLAALVWGLHAVAVARPAYLVFNAGRFDVVLANQLKDEHLARAPVDYRQRPLTGPRVVGAERPTDPEENSRLLMQALNGGDDIQFLPQHYVDIHAVQSALLKAVRPAGDLEKHNAKEAVSKRLPTHQGLGFVPLSGPVRDGVVWVDTSTGKYVGCAALKPW